MSNTNPTRYRTAGGSVIVWNGGHYTCGGCGDEIRSYPAPVAVPARHVPAFKPGSGCNKDGQGEQATARAHAAGCRESAGAALLVKAFGKGS